MEKGIRGGGSEKRERDIAEGKASVPASRQWLSVAGPLSQHQGLQGRGHIMKACLSSHSNITESAWKNSAPRATFINPARISSLQTCAERLPCFSSRHTLYVWGKLCHVQHGTDSSLVVTLTVMETLLCLPAVRKLALFTRKVNFGWDCCTRYGLVLLHFCLFLSHAEAHLTALLFVFSLSTSLS